MVLTQYSAPLHLLEVDGVEMLIMEMQGMAVLAAVLALLQVVPALVELETHRLLAQVKVIMAAILFIVPGRTLLPGEVVELLPWADPVRLEQLMA